ncbi:MAG: insulinase family protein [Candidatus Eisenbacteria bacterium]|nr:insulinase family protein [Candidatus Eisenbacteria bacterium]
MRNTVCFAPRLALLGLLLFPALAPAGPLKLPAYERRVLPNGLVLLVMPDHRLPLVQLHLVVKSGSTADPSGKEGLADLTATLLKRGTATRTAAQVAGDVDFLGARLETGADRDQSTVDMEVLKRNLDQGLALFGEVVTRPAFAPPEFDRARSEVVGRLAQLKDQPGEMADRLFFAELFGSHPYAHPLEGTEASVKGLTADDVRLFHRRHYLPNNAILAVVGDIEAAQAEQLVTRALAGWERGEAAAPVAGAVPPARQGLRIVLVDKPDAVQSEIRIGCLGAPRRSPDYYPVQVADAILGGGFTSRLVTEIRVRRGLSYSPHSREAWYKDAGAAYVSVNTKNKSTLETLNIIFGILKDMREVPLGTEELGRGRNYTNGLFPLRIEAPERLAGVIGGIEFYGLDPKWVDGFQERVGSTSSADVLRVMKTYFCDSPLLVVVGKRAEIEKDLLTLGKVEFKPM